MGLNSSIWHGMLANVAAVAVLTLIWTHLMQYGTRWKQKTYALFFGVIMGLGAVLVMQMPVVTDAGYRLDHRFTMIAASAFFGGPLSLAVTAGTAFGYRLYLAGVGAFPGLVGIAISSTIGLCGYFASTRPGTTKLWHVVVFSLFVTVGVTSGLFILPRDIWPTNRPDVAFPLSVTIFLATLVCALPIFHEKRRLAATQSNAIYQAIINALPDCLNVKDLDGRFIAVNPATVRLMQADAPADLIGKSDFDFYLEDVAQVFRKDEERVLASGKAATVEQKILRADRSLTWLSTLKAPLRDENGAVIGLITHNRDVTETRELERDLHQVRQTLNDAITNMNDGLAVYDHDGRLTFCNEQYRALFPLTADLRVPGALFSDILRGTILRGERASGREARQAYDDWLTEAQAEGFSKRDDDIEMADGRWLHVRRAAVETGILILVSDISMRRRAELDVQAAAREYRALFENSVAGIFRSTPDGKMLRANPALARLNGFTREQELLEAVNDIAKEWYVDPTRRDAFKGLMSTHGRVTDFVSQVYRFRTREPIWISETAWLVRDADGKDICYEDTITEITDRKLAEEELAVMNGRLLLLSRTDGLTGLANRRAFDESIAAEFERARSGSAPLSMMLIDVDHFKPFNDLYGHIHGDECLRFLAKALCDVPRDYGDKACRYGGEEMAVILPDTDSETALALAEKFRTAVRDLAVPHKGSDKRIVTVSIGVATMDDPDDFADPKGFIEEADNALYKAKAAGRDRVLSMTDAGDLAPIPRHAPAQRAVSLAR